VRFARERGVTWERIGEILEIAPLEAARALGASLVAAGIDEPGRERIEALTVEALAPLGSGRREASCATAREGMIETPVAPRFASAVEAQQAGPWRVVQQMPDRRWINAGRMTRSDVLELADHWSRQRRRGVTGTLVERRY
jgi:hypothetical protein